jgi:prepilin-type N-terminal cleavage/methylation domain-containing protein
MKMQKQGFTLVELLVVIAIIGLLSATVAFAITTVRARARDAKRAADIDQLSKGLDLYNNQTGGYPVSASPVCIDGNDAVTTLLTNANIITTPFKDPLYTDTTNCYRYVSDATGVSYSLRYFLETSVAGTPGFHTIP